MQCRKVDDSFHIYVVFSSSVLYVTRTNGLVDDKSLLLFGRNIRKSFYPQSCNSKDAYTVKIIMGLTSITYCMARKTNLSCLSSSDCVVVLSESVHEQEHYPSQELDFHLKSPSLFALLFFLLVLHLLRALLHLFCLSDFVGIDVTPSPLNCLIFYSVGLIASLGTSVILFKLL